MNRETEKKPSFVLKEFQAQKDKSINDSFVLLRPEMYARAGIDDKEAKLKKDTIGKCLVHETVLTNRTGPI
jgi:hypothetical protein